MGAATSRWSRFRSQHHHHHQEEAEETWNILLAGDGGVGKTSFAYQWSQNIHEPTYDPTLDEEHRKLILVDNKPAEIHLFDSWPSTLSYCRHIRSVLSSPPPSSHPNPSHPNPKSKSKFIFTFNSPSKKPFNDNYLTFILIGTKSDLSEQRQVSLEEGQALSNQLGCKLFFETQTVTSTGDGSGVNGVIQKLVRELRGLPPRPRKLRKKIKSKKAREGVAQIRG
ncbi:P-loop containing nucleoside triphosphate hydrolase protein [Pluteus cervinus]|uniref:P-loop containing nucleoside triphosphate hydrolase protein n=1 Tax=Pluteus cervinus TaxID=181527 RepID=A0ACD3B3I6_9AGAR|nr:P-loop containing nucleoside triphosphate hydrolase protein [Pluteus cervinus]